METNANQKVSCVVNYAYDASEPDELTIRPGDVIWDVDRLPGGWWRGELRGRRGMFPDNFVSLPNEHGNSRSVGVQDRCRAVYSYQPANPDELPLCVGDVLEVLGEVEEGWWQGRRQGRVGVFPSNFVVMLDPPQSAPPIEPAPALPPKPVKEQCRVLFPYTAVNEDELTLGEGEIVTIVSKDAPDRGWWRGELHGRVGLFPDNFVQLLPAVTTEVEEKKPDRPPPKPSNSIYPVLNKHFEKTASVKELTTSKISSHKENTLGKETSSQSTVTHTSKIESEKVVHNESFPDALDGQVKKPPVPLKKSPTPISSVGGLLSGLKNKMLSTSEKEKEKSSSTTVSSGSSSGGEWDRPDGAISSKPTAVNASTTAAPTAATTVTTTTTTSTSIITASTATFDHIERNSILNDPRAGRVKAPRRRPPSQALRDDTPQQIGLSNGHEVPEKPPSDKAEEIKPRTREWEKHKAPWMEELKLNQAKKTSFGADGKSRSVSGSSDGIGIKASSGSTDRILDCGLEEKKTSTHSMEMSKSTSSISSRMTVLENFEETKVRHSLDSKKETTSSRDAEPIFSKPVHSPTAAGRTLMSMLEEVKKPPAPAPPTTAPPTSAPPAAPASLVPPTVVARSEYNDHTHKIDRSNTLDRQSEISSVVTKTSSIFEKASTLEKIEKLEEKLSDRPTSILSGDKSMSSTLERRLHSAKVDRSATDGTEALIAQLNSRISNLEKLLELQNTMFKTAIDELNSKLKGESEKRQELKVQLEKLAQCVTQV